MTIKDAIAVKGVRSTGGAVELADHVPEQDAEVVSKIKTAGGDSFWENQFASLVWRHSGL